MSKDDKNKAKVRIDTQDRSTQAWTNLLTIMNEIELNSNPSLILNTDMEQDDYLSIRTLPREIGNLPKVTKLQFYGSNLERLPQEIGMMKSLENFIPYTSYKLKWFPYEITRCKNLRDSTISTRALFGNFKNKKPFPNLDSNPVQYYGGNKCSICNKPEEQERFEQFWLSMAVGTDVIPLLALVCSSKCYGLLGTPAIGYHPSPHKGGEVKIVNDEIRVLE